MAERTRGSNRARELTGPVRGAPHDHRLGEHREASDDRHLGVRPPALDRRVARRPLGADRWLYPAARLVSG